MDMSQRRGDSPRLLTATRKYSYTANHETTLEVPDALYRRVKVRAALEGKSVRDVTVGLFEGWLAEARLDTDAVDDGRSAGCRGRLASALGRARRDLDRLATDDRTTREILEADRR